MEPSPHILIVDDDRGIQDSHRPALPLKRTEFVPWKEGESEVTTTHFMNIRLMTFLGAALAFVTIAATASYAEHVPANKGTEADYGARLVIPMMSPDQGKILFLDKGCIACHAINGVGGHDAPPMDAHRQMGLVNPFDFAAKMWNHAPGMIAAQEDALGEQIYFTGDELADMIAFLHDDEAQHAFGEGDLTDAAKKMMQHEHGGMKAPAAHAEEVGHGHGAEPEHKP